MGHAQLYRNCAGGYAGANVGWVARLTLEHYNITVDGSHP